MISMTIFMTPPERVTVDDVLDLENSGIGHVRIAEALVEWSERVAGDSEFSAASLLVAAAEHLDMGGVDGAEKVLDRAETAVGHEDVDFFLLRVDHAFVHGDRDAALELEAAARRGPVKRYPTYEMMADTLDEHDAYDRALRWTNIGLRRMEDDPDADDAYEDLLLYRYEMRRRHDEKLDGYDQDAELCLASRDDEEVDEEE